MQKQRHRSAAQLINAFVFPYIDSTIPLLSKSEVLSSVAVQAVCVGSWSITGKKGFSRDAANFVK